MTLKQISVFVENKPGKLQQLTNVLAVNKINMRAMSIAETSDFGIVRIIADDVEHASAAIQEEGFIYTITNVLGVAIPDEPGGLNRVLQVLCESNVNVEYMYAFLGSTNAANACMIFHVQQPEAAVAALAAKGINCVDQKSLIAM